MGGCFSTVGCVNNTNSAIALLSFCLRSLSLPHSHSAQSRLSVLDVRWRIDPHLFAWQPPVFKRVAGRQRSAQNTHREMYAHTLTKRDGETESESPLILLSFMAPESRCLGTAYSLSEFLCTKQTAALSTSGLVGNALPNRRGRGQEEGKKREGEGQSGWQRGGEKEGEKKRERVSWWMWMGGGDAYQGETMSRLHPFSPFKLGSGE